MTMLEPALVVSVKSESERADNGHTQPLLFVALKTVDCVTRDGV